MKLYTKVLLYLFIISCTNSNQEKSEKEIQKAKLASLEEKGRNSKIILDTVLLGYSFEMTENQVLSHTRKLIRQKKLKVDYSNQPYFEIEGKSGMKYEGFITAKYFDNKLYSLGLNFKNEYSPIIVFSELSEIYATKYGNSDFEKKL
ncbi:MAG: hypothetical protein U1C70_01975 [Sediminibacterium sp.]|jgi:hypothetical protein|uniref:hypothetical protein n=1 Tax=Sediminibacterium sp. TaxID=1917865 RepID=UPI002ABAA926|nr:hypothetical protein [Sediminibacterium sp.]MDZ4070566.1 hypothetical protein [Sediminibacterium sp.]